MFFLINLEFIFFVLHGFMVCALAAKLAGWWNIAWDKLGLVLLVTVIIIMVSFALGLYVGRSV